jgi:hypothetical protein
MDIARVHIEKVIKAQQRCFLCTLEEECEKRYMEAYLAEYVMSPSSRDELVSSGGFCNHHSYVMLKVAVNPENADGHGIALTIKSIAEKFAEDLQKLKKKNLKRRGENVLDAQKCPACVHILRLMESYAEKTVQLLSSDHDFAKLYQASPGLCMPHFTWLVRKTTPLTPFCQQTCISVLVETQLKSLEKTTCGNVRVH